MKTQTQTRNFSGIETSNITSKHYCIAVIRYPKTQNAPFKIENFPRYLTIQIDNITCAKMCKLKSNFTNENWIG